MPYSANVQRISIRLEGECNNLSSLLLLLFLAAASELEIVVYETYCSHMLHQLLNCPPRSIHRCSRRPTVGRVLKQIWLHYNLLPEQAKTS